MMLGIKKLREREGVKAERCRIRLCKKHSEKKEQNELQRILISAIVCMSDICKCISIRITSLPSISPLANALGAEYMYV